MHNAKKYFRDKLMLLFMGANIFFAFLCAVLVFLRLSGSDGSEGYIVEYRSNLGIGAFRTGGVLDIVSFAVFSVIVASLSILISIGVYHIRRMLSVIILGSGLVLLIMTIIVSNALTVLR